MSVMSKQKKPPGRPKKDPSEKKDGISIHVSLDRSLHERLQVFCDTHPMEPTMTKIAEIAIRQYLDRQDGAESS